MARQKYTINSDDFLAARKWIDGKAARNWSDMIPNIDERLEAKKKLDAIRYKATQKAVKDLQGWCESYLDDKSWQQMKTTIRATRMREKSSGEKKQITVDFRAWEMLSAVADAEGVTLSQVIEKNLKKAYLKTIGTDAKLQQDLT
jgi:macrodomain Ter protein organizer (MatP/YcbG family)